MIDKQGNKFEGTSEAFDNLKNSSLRLSANLSREIITIFF